MVGQRIVNASRTEVLGAALALTGFLLLVIFVDGASRLELSGRGVGLVLMFAGGLTAFSASRRELWGDLTAGVRRARLPEERGQLLAVGAFTLIATALRLRYLNDEPFRYDEAYSFLYFASQPVGVAVSDYHVANNHILHSILMHFAWRIFGDGEWALRLPAFIPGVLLVPAIYLAGRALYDRAAGIVAAALATASTALIAYSVNGRGYSIVALLTVVLILLSARLQNRPGDGATWTLWVAVAVLGLYTIPIMAFPLALVATWLAVAALVDERGADRWRRLAPLVASCAATGAVAGLLYWPIRHGRGFDYEMLGHRTARDMIDSTLDMWTVGVPRPVQVLVVALALLGLALHRRVARQRVPLAVGFVAIPVVVAVSGSVPPFERTWLFLIPPVLLLAGAGVAALGGWIRIPAPVGVGACLLGAVLIGLPEMEQRVYVTDLGYARDPDAVVRYVAGLREEQPPVLVDQRSGMTWAFYLRRHGIPGYRFIDQYVPERDGQTVLVPLHEPETPSEAFARFGLPARGTDPVPVARFEHTTVFRLENPSG